MRLVFVIDSLGSGGAQRQLVLLFNAMRARGIDCWIVYYQPHHHFLQSIAEPDLGRVLCVGQQRGRGITSLLRPVQHELRRLEPDVVVSFLRGPSMLVGAVRAAGQRFRWIASERAGQFAPAGVRRTAAYLAAIRTADVVVPNSRSMADKLAARGIPRRRLQVVPNGVTLDEAALAAPIERETRPFKMVLVGTRVPEKNHPAVFEALGALTDRPWVLDHLGRTGENPGLDASVAKTIERHGLGERVREHGRQADVGRWYGAANLLVHPSLSEGFPNVVLEAWAWGCPVLVSDRCDLPHIVEHQTTGVVVRLRGRHALRDALAQALDDPAALQSLAVAGRERVRTEFSIDAIASRWMNIATGPALSLGSRIGSSLERVVKVAVGGWGAT